MEKEYLPTPRPHSLPQLPWLFSCSYFFAPTLRAEALLSSPHYRQSYFVLRVRESRDYSRKTTSSKNDLHGGRTTIFTASTSPKFKYYQSYSLDYD